MLQNVKTLGGAELGGGLVTYPNYFILKPNQSPNCMNVKFGLGNIVEKRLGSDTLNATAVVNSLSTGFAPDAGGTLTVGLEAFWKMDEQSGTRVASISELNLTDNNTVSFAAGILGNAGSYVAANSEYLSRADNSSLSAGTSSFSMTSWVRLDSKTADQVFLSKYSAANTANREYRLGYDVLTDRFYFDVRSGNTEVRIRDSQLGSPSTSTWYLLTGIHNSATSVSFIRINTLTANSLSTFSASVDSTEPFLVGVARSSPGFQLDSGGNLLQNLVAYWRLEEASGSRVDATGRGNTLTSNSAVGVVAGRVNSGASFIASSGQYLSIADNADLSTGNIDFTVAAWVYFDTVADNRGVVGKWAAGANEYIIRVSGVTIEFRVGDQAQVNGDAANGGEVLTGTWYFVVAWHDAAADILRIQVNNGTPAGVSYTFGVADLGTDFRIGYNQNDNVFMDGRIDEVGLWKRVLTTAERADLYYAGSGNRFSTDYANARIDEVGFWRKALSNQEVINLWNAGDANTYRSAVSNAGWGIFDFGASNLRWLTVAAGTGILASSNRGVAWVAIATDRGADYQYFERSKSFLIATSETQNKVLYWAGSVGTFMSALAPGSAPPAKHALSFQGFLFLMNDSAGKRRMSYVDENILTTSPWTTSFDLPSSFDDEITGGIILNKKAYISTKYSIWRLSYVGGNPDFAYQKVKDWGWVPGTQKLITVPEVGEVICAISWDKKLKLFDGSEDKVISDQIEQDNGLSPFSMNLLNTQVLNQFRAENDTGEQVYKLLTAITPSTNITHMLNFNYRTGAFYPYSHEMNAMVMAESGNFRALIGITRDGFAHQMDSGNTDAGVAIDEVYESPFFFGRTPRTASKSQKATLYFSATSSGDVYYQDRTNFNRTFNPAR